MMQPPMKQGKILFDIEKGEQMNNILQGDGLTVLKTLPSESVDCVITSPPYFALRSYLPKGHPDKKLEIGSEKTLKEYLDKMLEITAELKRILKKSGSFWLNVGDSYGGSNQGYGQEEESSGFQNVNDGFYGASQGKSVLSDISPKCMLGVPWRMALRMIDEQGWILRCDVKWIKQVYLHKEKRTIGSCLPSSVKDRFNQSGEYLFHFTKNRRYYFDLDSVRIPVQTIENRPQGIEREKGYPNAKRNRFDYAPFTSLNKFNYCVRDAQKKGESCPQFKATEKEITEYNGKFKDKEDAESFNSPRARCTRTKQDIHENRTINGFNDRWNKATSNPNGKNLPNHWLIPVESHNFSKEFNLDTDHFATFPPALCELPILTTCPKNGIVLDPFMGTGSTAIMAKKLGRKYLGVELNKDSILIAKKRLAEIPERIDIIGKKLNKDEN